MSKKELKNLRDSLDVYISSRDKFLPSHDEGNITLDNVDEKMIDSSHRTSLSDFSGTPAVYVAGKLNEDAIGYIRNLNSMFTFAEEVRKNGYAVFVPGLDILMGLLFPELEYEDHFNNSQPWLLRSDAVIVNSNWKESDGTKREISLAGKSDIPVFYDITSMNIYFGKI